MRFPYPLYRKLPAIFMLAALAVPAHFAAAAEMRIVGATEVVTMAEAGLPFLGRVDTGASTTSIHAVDIQVAGASPGMDCVGQQVAFTVINERGETCRLTARLEKVKSVRTSEGMEALYVYLTVGWQETEKRMLVNLNDRTAMQHRLLLGRNWLENDFLVDVARR